MKRDDRRAFWSLVCEILVLLLLAMLMGSVAGCMVVWGHTTYTR